MPELNEEAMVDCIVEMLNCVVSSENVQFLFSSTKLQSKSTVWKEMRLGRISASLVRDIHRYQ